MDVKTVSIESITPYDKNPRNNDDAVEYVANSIKEFGFQQPIVVDKDGVVIVGHTRLKAAKSLGMTEVPVVIADNLTDEQVKAYRLADNKTNELAGWDFDLLDNELADIFDIDMGDFGFEDDDFDIDGEQMEAKSLSDDFVVPPFSIIDTKKGEWLERKKTWQDMGIKSELGRDDNLTKLGGIDYKNYNVSKCPVAVKTSIFDPCLCEVMYLWFCKENGTVFDPFAGGSVRGIVSEKTGHKYTGIELRKEQVDANIKNAKELNCNPVWICDDSSNMNDHINGVEYDMIFSCPPYADLEVYSDNPKDISNMPYDNFLEVYRDIIYKSCEHLKDNSFAVFVVGEVRSKNGQYYNFVSDTIKAFKDAGLNYYDDIILATPIGNGMLRARRLFASRKVIKVHQNVLVFYKGDTREVKDHFPRLDETEDILQDI